MRVRAAAEIEAEKIRAIADVRAEVADLALLAAGRVVGESMTDERQRRLVEEFLRTAGSAGSMNLMAHRDTAARRYAEAAFEVAHRDGTVATWRRELDAAGEIAADETIGRALANPAVPLEQRTEMAKSIFGKSVSKPVLNLIGLMLRRGRIHELPRLAAEFRRLDNARQGITEATAITASPLTQDEIRALTERLEQLTGGRIELEVQEDPSLLGGLVVRVGDRMIDGSVRGRLERLRNQLVSGTL